MLQARWQDLTADSLTSQRQGMCRKPASFPAMCYDYQVAAFPSVSVLLSHYPGASGRLHTTGLLLKVMTEPAKCKASALPPCGIKAAKDTLLRSDLCCLRVWCGWSLSLGNIDRLSYCRLIGECWNQQGEFW